MDINDFVLWIVGGSTVAVILSIILSVICTIVPLAAVGWFIYSRFQKAKDVQQASQNWLATTGRVIKSRVEVSGGEVASVYPRVIYEYEVEGVKYQADQIKAGDKFWAARTSQEAYNTIDRYPEGLEVTVYYNPANPAEATLERG
ncbi:MAG: DUF3592 domain-containing protein [Anaerolineales bacterium]|nr:DUF3592 domain-containing protein [Anaerolineales bacterium]